MKRFKKATTLFLTLIMALVLVACGGDAGDSADASAGGEETSAAASTEASVESTGELKGKPWVTSILMGNLPPEQPEMKDDLFTHYTYDYLASHQLQPSSAILDHAAELQAANLAMIKDESKTGHDLEQLRIFFGQASDTEGLKEKGLADLQPYLDRIDAATSLEEMNALLAADDFPFSPFVTAIISSDDTRDVNIATVQPNLVLVDAVLVGGTYYQDTDDPQQQEAMDLAVRNAGVFTTTDLADMGMSSEEVASAFDTILGFEKVHGKYIDYNGKYSTMDFGAAADAARNSQFTPEELYAACPNFPMQATLDKLGKGASPRFTSTREWLNAFNELWTEENLDTIKLVAKASLLKETRPYRYSASQNKLYEDAGRPAPDAETFAYDACNQSNTLAIVLAENYINDTLGANAKDRLTALSQQIIDAYKNLISETPWMSAESQDRVIEKLDNMTLNVLEPVGGYYSFDGVELTPTDEGGTLLDNYLKLKQYHQDKQSKMIGQPVVAACPWFYVKPTELNAFYDPVSNSINILPGYVTSLVYTEDMSDADLLSGVGFSIGHEISHGFDYDGAQFDAYGTPNPIFTGGDVDAFVLKSSALASYYKGIEVMPGTNVNGENVVTEATADLCGLQATLAIAAQSDNMDYDAFFGHNAYLWATVVPEETMPTLLLDAHPLVNLRTNINAQMFDPIYTELGVKEGDGMYLAPEERINIYGPNS